MNLGQILGHAEILGLRRAQLSNIDMSNGIN